MPAGSARGCIKPLAWLFSLLLAGCAQQVAPTGGEKDTAPPKILYSYPQNESLNYRESRIEMQFDEYVQLRDAPGQLIVSPPLEHPVKFTLKGKKLEVEWRDTLDEHTTYMFQFGEGIVDLHEGNVLDSNVFVFSTGNYLDSFELKGSVRNAFDLKPAEGVWVMLYTEDVDSLPLTALPRYFARTDANGFYHLRYLQPGSYKIFGLKSVNQGYTYDLPDELIAFETTMVRPVVPGAVNRTDSGTYSGPSLLLFQETDSTQYVEEHLLLDNKALVLRMHMPVEELTITDLTGKDISGWEEEWSAYRDSVAFWFDSLLTNDSLYLRVQTSAGFDDTLKVRKRSLTRGQRKAATTSALKLTTSNSRGSQDYFRQLTVRASEPLREVHPQQWILKLDTDTLDLAGLVEIDFRSIAVDVPWKQKSNYELIIPDSTVFGKYGKANDTLRVTFTTTAKEHYGQLIFHVEFEGVEHPLIWQLIKGEKIVDDRVISATEEVHYDHLKPGTYRVKVLFDVNGNGLWDTGDYGYQRQPERVIFYEDRIEVRSNWMEEVNWDYSPEP